MSEPYESFFTIFVICYAYANRSWFVFLIATVVELSATVVFRYPGIFFFYSSMLLMFQVGSVG